MPKSINKYRTRKKREKKSRKYTRKRKQSTRAYRKTRTHRTNQMVGGGNRWDIDFEEGKIYKCGSDQGLLGPLVNYVKKISYVKKRDYLGEYYYPKDSEEGDKEFPYSIYGDFLDGAGRFHKNSTCPIYWLNLEKLETIEVDEWIELLKDLIAEDPTKQSSAINDAIIEAESLLESAEKRLAFANPIRRSHLTVPTRYLSTDLICEICQLITPELVIKKLNERSELAKMIREDMQQASESEKEGIPPTAEEGIPPNTIETPNELGVRTQPPE